MPQKIPTIKKIIAIASGKGGVGKSTTAVNIALALIAKGFNVGLLDADIYGPSQPLMLGVTEDPIVKDKKIWPIIRYGIQSMSIGYLVDDKAAVVWRGPMVSAALQQLLNDTQWDNLDYLIIDLPPGTGDIQLTLAQKIPVDGAIIVTTPQDLALLDARRAFEMFRKVNVPILGLIENMAVHVCSQCGHEDAIFGLEGGKKMATQYEIDFLGSLPLHTSIREATDAGKPSVVADPCSDVSKIYLEIADQLVTRLASYEASAANFPKITIKND